MTDVHAGFFGIESSIPSFEQAFQVRSALVLVIALALCLLLSFYDHVPSSFYDHVPSWLRTLVALREMRELHCCYGATEWPAGQRS